MFKPGMLAYHEPMRIVCPSCAARYEVPETRLVPGKPVKCAKCGASWAPLAAAPPPAPPLPPPPPSFPPTLLPATPGFAGITAEPDQPSLPPVIQPEAPAPEPAPMVEAPEPSEPWPPPMAPRVTPTPLPPSGRAAITGWVLTIMLLGGLGTLAVTQRVPIMRAWPPSERAYAALKLIPR